MDHRGMLLMIWLSLVGGGLPAAATARQVTLVFFSESEQHAAAVAEYRDIWAADGARIISALETATGLEFMEDTIRVRVAEGPSFSGFGSRPMRMRASYPEETKKGTLIHELGHRLHGRFFRRDDEDHPFLFLYLYDVWVTLYGQAFADSQVQVESGRRGLYDYESAWREALELTASERQEKWRAFMANRSDR